MVDSITDWVTAAAGYLAVIDYCLRFLKWLTRSKPKSSKKRRKRKRK